MASFSIQFHATLNELIDFVAAWMSRFDAHASAIYLPFRVESISAQAVSEVLSRPEVRSVMFTEPPANLSAANENELLDNNTGCLLLDIGRVQERGLEESCLNTMSASGTWRKIANDLKRQTSAGAIGAHEITGAVAHYRNRRFTAGARALSEQGTVLRQFAQLPVIFRPDQ